MDGLYLRWMWTGLVARTVENRGVYRILMGKPEGKSSLGRPRFRGEDNFLIFYNLQEVRCECMDWTDVTQDRDGCYALVNEVMNLLVP
jgi:hypothetical protein